MGKTARHISFTIEPVKPRNRVVVDGLKRRGGPHVKPYGAIRKTHKNVLRNLLDNDDAEEEEVHMSERREALLSCVEWPRWVVQFLIV